MSHFLSSTAFSICVHAVVLVGLYLVPAVIRDRFHIAGKKQAITLELTSATPPSPTSVEFISTENSEVEKLDDPPNEKTEAKSADLQKPKENVRPIVLESLLAAKAEPHLQPKEIEFHPASAEPPPIEQNVAPKPRSERLVGAPEVRVIVPPVESAGTQDQPVEFTENTPPEYPDYAFRNRLQGTVLLQLNIDINGNVHQVHVLKSSGHEILDEAAANAVRQWRGKPAMRHGKPVESQELLPIRFRL